MKSKHLVGIIILLGLINFIFFYYKNIHSKKTAKVNAASSKNPCLPIKYIPDFVLWDLNDMSYSSQDILKDSGYILLVFFSIYDCALCLYEMELWKRIFEERKLKIIGITGTADREELKDWTEKNGIFFPVLYDTESQATKNFGISETPLKVLIDSSGKILLVDNAKITYREREEFITKIDKILDQR